MGWLGFRAYQDLSDHQGRKDQLDPEVHREMRVAQDPEGQMVLMVGWAN